jgi:hypothetical protein
MENGQPDTRPSCVFKEDPKLYIPSEYVSLQSPPETFSAAAAKFRETVDAYNTTTVGRWRRIREAKAALVAAEDTRGTDPEGYQRARVNYYTLLQGDLWNKDETERILKTEVEPKANDYMQRITDLLNRNMDLNNHYEAVTQTSEKILSTKDGVGYITDVFSEQLDKLGAETTKEKREAAAKQRTSFLWFDGVLNWAIIILLVTFILVVAYYTYKSYGGSAASTKGVGTISAE